MPPPNFYLGIRKFLILCTAAFTVFFILNSCNKGDNLLPNKSSKFDNRGDKFFEIMLDADPAMQRVMAAMKIMNVNPVYWKEFGRTNGLPVWNRTLKINSLIDNANNFSNSTASRDTIFYIPMVLEGDSIVNGFIRARIKDSVFLNYSLAENFTAFEYYKDNRNSPVADFTTKLMLLNRLVFGYSSFKLNDERIFSEDTLTKNNYRIQLEQQTNAISTVCNNSNLSGSFCGSPGHPKCTPFCDWSNPCEYDLCFGYSYSLEVCITTETIVSTSYPVTTTSGSPGNNTMPMVPQCNPFCPLPIRPGPIVPIYSEDPTEAPPCDPFIKALETNQVFSQKFKSLKDNAPSPDDKETMLATTNINDPAAYDDSEGLPNEFGMNFPQGSSIKAVLHRHFFHLNDMFSTGDFWNYCEQDSTGNAATQDNYFWGMIGPNGYPYILKNKDKARIAAWLNTPGKTFKNFNDKYYTTINKEGGGDDQRSKINEVGFLNMIDREGLNGAIELFIGINNSETGPSFTKWQKLKTDSRNATTINCQ